MTHIKHYMMVSAFLFDKELGSQFQQWMMRALSSPSQTGTTVLPPNYKPSTSPQIILSVVNNFQIVALLTEVRNPSLINSHILTTS